jgi:3-methylcrotonyl-CoA carboxylase beta subunit
MHQTVCRVIPADTRKPFDVREEINHHRIVDGWFGSGAFTAPLICWFRADRASSCGHHCAMLASLAARSTRSGVTVGLLYQIRLGSYQNIRQLHGAAQVRAEGIATTAPRLVTAVSTARVPKFTVALLKRRCGAQLRSACAGGRFHRAFVDVARTRGLPCIR